MFCLTTVLHKPIIPHAFEKFRMHDDRALPVAGPRVWNSLPYSFSPYFTVLVVMLSHAALYVINKYISK